MQLPVSHGVFRAPDLDQRFRHGAFPKGHHLPFLRLTAPVAPLCRGGFLIEQFGLLHTFSFAVRLLTQVAPVVSFSRWELDGALVFASAWLRSAAGEWIDRASEVICTRPIA